MKRRIEVSPEMLSFVGLGPISMGIELPVPVAFAFYPDAKFSFQPGPAAQDSEAAELVLVVTTEACRRIFNSLPSGCARWHIPTEMRAIVIAIVDCDLSAAPRETFCLAKSIELLCATFEMIAGNRLVPVDGAGELSEHDAQRIVAARRVIDERWREKLTIDAIASASGLNRGKLTRGFRAMFDCSVGQAISDRRLAGARDLLLATDLPIASIGYSCGYLNNASFTRAFSRKFGLAPTRLRAGRIAA